MALTLLDSTPSPKVFASFMTAYAVMYGGFLAVLRMDERKGLEQERRDREQRRKKKGQPKRIRIYLSPPKALRISRRLLLTVTASLSILMWTIIIQHS